MNERIQELACYAWRATSDEVAHLNRMHNRAISHDEQMDVFEQKCLINGTICASKEEEHVNNFIASKKYDIHIVIYGKNAYDEDKLLKKYYQLKQLGFKNLYIYIGGMFEWLLLQDIYGNEEFPTSCKENDIMKYKPSSNINRNLLTY